MLTSGVNNYSASSAETLIAKLSEQSRQVQTTYIQDETKSVNAPSQDEQIGSSRKTLLNELEDEWGVKVAVTAVGAQGNKAFAMGMVNAGVSRSVGISPIAMQKMQNDPEFKEEVTQNVAEHIKTFDSMMSSMPGENKAYGLLVDDEGNISSWSYVEHTSGDSSKEEYWEELKEKIAEDRQEKREEQKKLLEEGDEKNSQSGSTAEANTSDLSDLVKAAVMVDITV